jgi:hypothetical protein
MHLMGDFLDRKQEEDSYCNFSFIIFKIKAWEGRENYEEATVATFDGVWPT